MNFVETGKPVFIKHATSTAAHVEAEVAQSETTKAAGNTKAFIASMVLSMVVFSFTMSGLLQASGWATDRLIERNITSKAAELNKPLPLPQDFNDDTTTADASSMH